jgi:hypothetical protein
VYAICFGIYHLVSESLVGSVQIRSMGQKGLGGFFSHIRFEVENGSKIKLWDDM